MRITREPHQPATYHPGSGPHGPAGTPAPAGARTAAEAAGAAPAYAAAAAAHPEGPRAGGAHAGGARPQGAPAGAIGAVGTAGTALTAGTSYAAGSAGTAGAGTPAAGAPALVRRRVGVLPAVAGALSVRGRTLTCTGAKADRAPELHPLVAAFLATLPVARRSRGTGRCPEALLLSRHLTTAEAERRGRAARRPLTDAEARRALKHAVVTTRRIREDGDPAHGHYAPPCPACAVLLDHFGVRTAEPVHA